MTHKLYKNNKIEEKKYNTKSYLSYFPCYYHEIHLHCMAIARLCTTTRQVHYVLLNL